MTALDKLLKYAGKLSAGEIIGDDYRNVIKLLIGCWEDLNGSGETSMKIEKLDRCENLTFIPPATIQFEIERHGATVFGSIYAEVHRWSIDLETGDADCDQDFDRRTVGERDKVQKTESIAEKVFQEIMDQNRESENLTWKSDTKVKVRIGDIIPETKKETTTARRKRFRKALEDLLTANGWRLTKAYNIYEKV